MSFTPPSTDEDAESAGLRELRNVILKPGALVDKISPVIADVLTEQIKHSGDEIAQAIAPVIGEAIRRQVYSAREDIIDALYPVIGQTINRAVTCWAFGLEMNAVWPISATSAALTSSPVSGSTMACG